MRAAAGVAYRQNMIQQRRFTTAQKAGQNGYRDPRVVIMRWHSGRLLPLSEAQHCSSTVSQSHSLT